MHYSPDGRWWWDGREWRPVPSLSAPGRHFGAFPVWAIVVLACFVGLFMLGGGGLLTALENASGVSPDDRMPAMSPPAASPAANSRQVPTLQGVTVAQVTAPFRQQGYHCGTSRHMIGTWITSCRLSRGGLYYGVTLGGSTASSVDVVEAGIVGGSREPTNADAGPFFAQVMNALGPGNGAPQASAWVQQNLATGGDTSAGAIRAHLSHPGSVYLLTVNAT